jgi:hypothetical protein
VENDGQSGHIEQEQTVLKKTKYKIKKKKRKTNMIAN